MTRQEAMRQATKRWGKRAAVRVDDRNGISSPERRAAAGAKTREVRAQIEAIDREIDERLKALDWLQELQRKRQALRKEQDAVSWQAHYYKFNVGYATELFFHVEGSGDTWEEAFGKVTGKAVLS